MSGHAKLSPSASHRWLNCPGSIEATKGIPGTSNEYADEGTYAHDVAARCLDEGCDPHRFLGEKSKCGRFEVDGDMVEHLQGYVDLVRQLADSNPSRKRRAPIRVETKVHAIKGTVYGTADAIVIDPPFLHVVDLKYGAGVYVDVVDNPQLRIYGLGALRGIGKNDRARTEWVVVHVYQPRHPRGGHSQEAIHVEDLYSWDLNTLKPGVQAVTPDAELAAGDWCRFCPAKPTCHELRRASLESAASVFDDVEDLVPAKTPPSPKDLSPTDLGKLMALFPMVEDWISAVREHAYELANRGVRIPGHKLVEKTVHRKWIDEAKTAAALASAGVDPYNKPKLVTPAEAERRLKPKGMVPLVAKLSKKPKAGTVLALLSDKRKEVHRADVFESEES